MTTNATVKSIIHSLLEMSKKEQRQVYTALKSIVKDEEDCKQNIAENANIDLFFSVLNDYLYKTVKQKLPKIHLLRTTNVNTARALYECTKSIDEYGDGLLGKKMNRKQRLLFYDLYLRLVIKHLRQTQIVVSPNNILNAHGRFPGILDKFYPNYAQNGLFLLLIEPKKQSIL